MLYLDVAPTPASYVSQEVADNSMCALVSVNATCLYDTDTWAGQLLHFLSKAHVSPRKCCEIIFDYHYGFESPCQDLPYTRAMYTKHCLLYTRLSCP